MFVGVCLRAVGRADMTFEGYIELMKAAWRSEAEVSGIVKIGRGRLAALCGTKSHQMLWNLPSHCVKMHHCDWFNKKLNGQELGRRYITTEFN